MSTKDLEAILILDEAKLSAACSAERGEMFVLTWLAGVENALQSMDQATIRQYQSRLTTDITSLLAPPSGSVPRPKPGRPARAIMSRILIELLEKGEANVVYDVNQVLLKGMVGSELKGAPEKEKEWRVACAWCLGELWIVFGSSVMSLFLELLQTTTKIFKTSSHAVILRTSALQCLRKALITGARSLSDQVLKDTLKSLRSMLSDKAGAIVREAAECLLVLSKETTAFSTISEIDSLLSVCYKALESADHVTRRSVASLVAGVLALTQVEVEKKVPAPSTPAVTDNDNEDHYPDVGVPHAENTKKALLEPNEMLEYISSAFNSSKSSKQLRIALVDVYSALFVELGGMWIETQYSLTLKHLVCDIGCGQASGLGWSGWNERLAERSDLNKARFDSLEAQKICDILLNEVVGKRLLSEEGQVLALSEAGNILSRWDNVLGKAKVAQKQDKETILKSKQGILILINHVSRLLVNLGCIPPGLSIDTLQDTLVRLVGYPSYSVQIQAASCMGWVCSLARAKLGELIAKLLEEVGRDMGIINTGADDNSDKEGMEKVHRRAIGHARALASLISLVPRQPLYVSFDLTSKCLSLSLSLLKQSSNHPRHVSAIEIEAAWLIIQGLMSLGPGFVGLHLNKVLLSWRGMIPRLGNKESVSAAVRGDNEWAWGLHIRTCTLSSILSFLLHNSGSSDGSQVGLVTEDVAKRLVQLLSNSHSFLLSYQTARPLSNYSPAISSTLSLQDRAVLLSRRIFQCFVALGRAISVTGSPVTKPYEVDMLRMAVEIIGDEEKYVGDSGLMASVAASSGAFTNVWEGTDGFGYGVTSLINVNGSSVANGNAIENNSSGFTQELVIPTLNQDAVAYTIEKTLRLSLSGAIENDPIVLTCRGYWNSISTVNPPPPATGLVDAAIELFALFWPLQEQAVQLPLLQDLTSRLHSVKLDKNPGRKMAVEANVVTCILGSLRVLMKLSGKREIPAQSVTAMRDFLRECIIHSNDRIRQTSAEAMGRLSSLAGTQFMAAQIQYCVKVVVENTDPECRAGCALTFGRIYEHVGGLSAGPVLKTIVDVLLSLSADPHPLVHYTALQALSEVIGAASLAYSPFVNATLGLLCKLFMADTHEPEGGSPGSVNMRGSLPAYQAICRVVDAVIGVLGPELQDSERTRDLVLILLKEFVRETDDGITVEAIRATQHFLIFAPTALDLGQLVATLRSQLSSLRQPLRVAAVNSIYQLVQRDAIRMSKVAGDGLVQQLFSLLDADPTIEGVRDVILSWLRQTADSNPSGWIDLCQRIMSRSSGTKQAITEDSAPASASFSFVFRDEEAEGLGIEQDTVTTLGIGAARNSSRWRTQLFALQCLHEIFVTVKKSGRTEHFDIELARQHRANRRGLLLNRVSDLIKMAFTASTAQVMEIRLEGLVVLRDVIENFSTTRDFDFEEALILDQYQAPIAAALTPAFASDSYPEVLASAIQICAVFVGSGVIKEIEKMGRILKLLTSALESCRDSDMSSIGEVKNLSSTAAIMLKTSIFAAWAQFQTASLYQPYLINVIKPHLPLLCNLWVASLREYARIRTDPDATASDGAFDSVYSGLTRETALPFYDNSWPQMLHAVATLLKVGDPHMIKAMDGSDSTEAKKDGDPTLFFWVLFGLAFAALCSTPTASGATSSEQIQVIALDALVGLLRPDISGKILSDPSIFGELSNLCYRLAIVEGPKVKESIANIAYSLAKSFAFNLKNQEPGATGKYVGSGESMEKDENMMQCLRIATCVLRESIPSCSSNSLRPTPGKVSSHSQLLSHSIQNYANIADLYPNPMRDDLYSIIFHFYSLLLKDENFELDLVGPTLPSFKAICDRAFNPVDNVGLTDLLPKVLNAVVSACVQNIDQVKSRRGAGVLLKIKNNLMTTVLIISSLPSHIKIGQEAVERTCSTITQLALSEDLEFSRIGVNCLKSLLMATGSNLGSSMTIQYCVGQLLPGVIEYIARGAETGFNEGDSRFGLFMEMVQCFVNTVTKVKENSRVQAVAITMSVLLLLLSPEAPSPTHTYGVSQLLKLANLHSNEFKIATGLLGEKERKTLETSLRAEMGTEKLGKRDETPKINLKSFI